MSRRDQIPPRKSKRVVKSTFELYTTPGTPTGWRKTRTRLSASYRNLHAYSSKSYSRMASQRRAGFAIQAAIQINTMKPTNSSNAGGYNLFFPLGGILTLDKLKDLVSNDRDAILRLEEVEANEFMSLLQRNIDNMNDDDEHRGVFIDILLQLAVRSSIVPRCLEITGITDCIEEPIATGGFGDVYWARWKDQKVALKRLRNSNIGGVETEKLHRNLCKEVLLWRQLHHPNVLKFLGICKGVFTSPVIVSPWMNNGNVMQFTEVCHFHDRKQLVYRLLSQVARALEYLHGQNPVVVHQDVRCANILVNSSCEAVLSDFGLSRLDTTFFNTFTSSLEHGCLRWQAPELLFPDPPACLPNPTPASDIYALGMTALELITQKMPFSSVVLDAAVVIEIYHSRRPEHGNRVDTRTWQFLSQCWSKTPSARPSSGDAVQFFLTAAANHQQVELPYPIPPPSPQYGFANTSAQQYSPAMNMLPLPRLTTPGFNGGQQQLSGPGPQQLRGPGRRQDVIVQVPKELFDVVSGKDYCNFRKLEKGYRVMISASPSEDRSSDKVTIMIEGSNMTSVYSLPSLVMASRAKAEVEKLVELYQRFGYLM